MILILWFAFSGGREPNYEGRSLTEWLQLYGKAYEGGDDGSGPKAIGAISAIGTNALPRLLKMVARGKSAWKYQVMTVAARGPRRFADWWEGRLAADEQERLIAVYGFGILGSNAAPAIPDLIGLLDKNNFNELMVGPKGALIAIGAPAFPYLLEAAGNRDAPVPRRVAAIYALAYAGTSFREDPSALITCLGDDNADVATGAAMALETTKVRPDLAMPALIKALGRKEPKVRVGALSAIGQLCESRESCREILGPVLTDPDLGVRVMATNFFKLNDRERFEGDGGVRTNTKANP